MEDKVINEFEKKFKDCFAYTSKRCKKCGHNESSHIYYATTEYAELYRKYYDVCKECGCNGYNDEYLFEEVVDYEPCYYEILSWLKSI